MPLFSIVTPTYNRAYALPSTAAAVLQQECDEYEWIIVDDGSDDDTQEVVEKLREANPRIVYVHQENKGRSHARNTGVEKATGEWVVYLDSDDEVYPYFLSEMKKTFEQNPTCLYGACNHDRQIVLIDKDRNIIDQKEKHATADHKATLRELYHWKIKPTGTGIFHKRSLWNEGFRWDPDAPLIEDLELIFQFGAKYPEAFEYIEKPLLFYVQAYGGDGICSNATYGEWAKAFTYLYEKHQDDPLMQGQQWFPAKKEKYEQLQKEFDEGNVRHPVYKYFPNYKPNT